MATIIAVCSWVIAGVVWGDWRNWAKYHTTVFYFMFCDIMYYLVTVDHRLWSLEPTWPLHSELVVIWGELIVFTSTVLIFLGRYPAGRFISIWWTLLWVSMYTFIEWILLLAGTFKYSNGWTLLYSFLFSILVFVFLRLHYLRPLTTYILSIPTFFILIYLNSVPLR
jgi:hypothetical protein